MKKNLKKLVSTTLSLIIALALSITAFAAEITADKAKEIALKDAGYTTADVLYIKAEVDYEKGVKEYDVEFAVKGADVYYEFDYEVRANDGKILSKDKDVEKIKPTTPGTGSGEAKKDIGQAEALKKAYAAFGFTEDQVKLIEVKKDYDDGVLVYEVDFITDYNCEYSCDVIAATGKVVDMDKDVSETVFDKIELFFKAIIAQLLAR